MTWMSYIMHYVQKVLLIRVPPSNESNYFIDPKIMTLGEPDFEPRKIDYKISELKFLQMRQDMINPFPAICSISVMSFDRSWMWDS